MRVPTPARTIVVSVFIVLNIFTVLFMNTPAPLEEAANRSLATLGPAAAHRLRLSGWLLKRYAHVVGLDNRWRMFGRQSRFRWWYLIKARHASGEETVLPLSGQSERTFWQDMLFDFKEAKFQLNIYDRADLRAAYAHYLCRQFDELGDSPIRSIVFELHHQMILDPAEAARRGTHLAPLSHERVLQEVPCRD